MQASPQATARSDLASNHSRPALAGSRCIRRSGEGDGGEVTQAAVGRVGLAASGTGAPASQHLES